MYLKDLIMYPGTSKIIRRSSIDDDLSSFFVKASTPGAHYFHINSPINDVDQAILEFLKRQKFCCSREYVEYWFQEKETGQDLWPHVDFNDKLRIKLSQGESVPPERLMSPITIACYLEIHDMEGGELCISDRSWLDYEREIQPVEELRKEMYRHAYELISPKQGDVLYFEGSRYYHWINTVRSGSRKSMLINFWDEVDLPLRPVS